jgi:hypothetical protein
MAATIRVRFPKDINKLNIKAVMQGLQARLKSDPTFRNKVRKDPVGVLIDHGIPRPVAVAIVADDVGVGIGPQAGDITTCCCSACSYSKSRLFDMTGLPAIDDAAGWRKLAAGRG